MRGVCVMNQRKKKSHKSNAYQRKQERYIKSKKSQQKVEILPRRIKRRDLPKYIEQFQPMVEEANDRITKILEAGYRSMAVERVEMQTKREYFTLDFVENRGDLLSMITAMRVFLADKGSTLEGAKEETILATRAKYKGKFGNEYNTKEHNFARYDTSTIKKEDAEEAFATYRRIEEKYAYYIGRQGADGAYGSENLIIAVYDAVIKSKENKNIDPLTVGMEIMKEFVDEQNKTWNKLEAEANSTMAINGYDEDNLKGDLIF